MRLRLANRHGKLPGDTRPMGTRNLESGLLIIGINDPTDVATKIKDIVILQPSKRHRLTVRETWDCSYPVIKRIIDTYEILRD